jgi:Uma2 family endonuclease
MSFEEFLAWGDEDVFAEWVDGKVEIRMSTTDPHQAVVQFITWLLLTWNSVRAVGGYVQTAPYPMLLMPVQQKGRTVRGFSREPDVMYIAPENKERVTTQYLNGPADIVVEIISPESRRRDRQTKYFEYERAGVREYWTHEPSTGDCEFFRLGENGRFYKVELENDGTLFRSEVLPGFVFDLNWLQAEPFPPIVLVMQTWGLVPQPSGQA